MNGCEKYQELISAAIDNELSSEEKAELAEHLKVCSECASLYRAFEGLSSAMTAELEEMPAELHENIMAEIRREDIKKKNKKLSKPLKTILASAACAVFIVGAAFIAAPKGAQAPAAVSLSSTYIEAENSTSAESYSRQSNSVSEGLSDSYSVLEESERTAGKAAPDSLQSAAPEAPAMMFSSAPNSAVLYELEQERWDSFRELLSGSSTACSEEPQTEAALKVCLKDCAEGSFIELYSSGEGLIYYDSSDGNYHKADSDMAEVDAFLNIS